MRTRIHGIHFTLTLVSSIFRNLSDNENGFHLQNQSGRNSASYGSLGDGGEKLSGNNSPLFADSFSPDVTTMEKSDWAVEVSPSSGIGGFADQTTEALINSIAHIRVLLPADQPSDNNSRWGEIPMEKSCWGPPPTKPAPKPPTPGEFSLWDAPAPVANELPSSGFISAPIPAGIWSFSPVEKHGSEAGEKSNQQGWGPTHSGAVGNDFASLARQIAAGMLKPNGNAPAVANNWVPPPTPDNFYGANDYRYYGTKAESQISQMKPNYRV